MTPRSVLINKKKCETTFDAAVNLKILKFEKGNYSRLSIEPFLWGCEGPNYHRHGYQLLEAGNIGNYLFYAGEPLR